MGALDFLRGAGELPAEEKPEIILCSTENDPSAIHSGESRGRGASYSKAV